MSIVYVYALVDGDRTKAGASPSLRPRGRRIQVIGAGEVRALVERVESPPPLSEDSLRAQYDVVVEIARRFDAILPVRFGAAVDSTELERLLAVRQARLRRALGIVRGREQMTVRIFGPVRSEPFPTRELTTGTAYLRARSKMSNDRLPPAAKRVRRAVKPLVARERIEAGQGRVRAALHHLIPRGCAAEYTTLAQYSVDAIGGSEEIVISGPLPPFAFTPDLWP
jgi:hypothetical protein